ncbi:MFS transporter [Legionella worsleiensis]|uniref:Proline/betaine transporter ProP6 n=1 Tax=Legionella worsleiensis TaxID=45076 RepID=A0A0W1AF61_9GAMM|nr:MFS transporter [Legionella worsleiensis]KTD79967.1 proline/betaine transporter ProP6 [Legionella worsleiensis]STY32438.1 putative proline/glycine betaine transporter [Legionella worsleiensis]
MKHQNKVILGGLMGNIVEAYDMSICYFLSAELSQNLLGETKGRPTVMLSLIFIAYLAKPIGAFFLGLLSDLYGRKNVLMASILIMGISTALIGVIPAYDQIGMMAVACLLSFRIIQSMALGSEFLNSSSLLVESGDTSQRGFRGCWSSFGVKAGYLIACLVAEAFHYYSKTNPDLHELWRIPFLFALLTTVIGFLIRAKMPESLAYIIYYSNRKKPTTKEIYKQSLDFVKRYPFMFYFAFFSVFLSVTTGFFFYLYIPLHAVQYAHIPHDLIMKSNMLSLLAVTILIPLFGRLSDKRDRLKMLIFASSGLLIMTYPFMHIINYGNTGYFILMQLIISVPCACYYSVSTVLLTELFPLQIRCTALSIVYSVSASLAAGLPPLLADYLARTTQMPSSPSLIIMVLAAVVLINVRYLARHYRKGINSYQIAQMDTELPVFTVHYQKPT